jgi:hypothetical protein
MFTLTIDPKACRTRTSEGPEAAATLPFPAAAEYRDV